MSVNNISFILHKPQLSENIGACARGMKNFNFNKLIIVDSKPIFPNDKILATSVGAKNIINKAKSYENIEKSLKNIDIVIATSARFRNKNIKHIQLEDLKKININDAEKIVHDVLNVFMLTGFTNDTKQYFMKSSPVRPGDYLEFFAETDLLGALSACPGGDCGSEHSSDVAKCYPLKVSIWTVDPKYLKDIKPSTISNYNRNHGID